MIEVKDLLGIKLEDDETTTGGTAFAGETVKDFADEMGIGYNSSLFFLNSCLKECGIKEIVSW